MAAAAGAERASALEPVYAAEGSDWFWWFGDDQDSGNDEVFDELFRGHLRSVYDALGHQVPSDLSIPLVRRHVVWTFAKPVSTVAPGDELIVRTNCPGLLAWQPDGLPMQTLTLEPVGGVLAGARRFQAVLGTVERSWSSLSFRFSCGEAGCRGHDRCCQGMLQTINVACLSSRKTVSADLGA